MSENNNYPWISALGISIQAFRKKPEEQNHLSWAFEKKIIDEIAYVGWASNHYEIPALKADFFTLAFDPSLVAKYSELYNWSADCYPVYFWQNTLFIACNQPVELNFPTKACFVVAPHSSLQEYWQKVPTQQSQQTVPPAPEPPIVTAQQPEPSVVAPTEPAPPTNDLDNLDFSAVDESTQAEPNQETQTKAENTRIQQLTSATQTVARPNQPQELSVTQQAQATEPETPASSLDVNLDFSDLAPPPIPNNEPSAAQTEELPPPPVEAAPPLDVPSLDDLKDLSTAEVAPAPGLEEKTDLKVPEINPEELDDDYTPVPVITKSHQQMQRTQELEIHKTRDHQTRNTQEESRIVENTISRISQEIVLPKANVVSDTELVQSLSLEECTELKHVVAHCFNHLKRDYKHLLWVNQRSDTDYFPKFVYGNWQMTELAWKMHINLANPNIFRVACNSEQPFHGIVHNNPYNQKYFDQWLNGQLPNFVTIFPVIVDDNIIGFLCGFNSYGDFSEKDTLKKFENLVSICRRSFTKFKTPLVAA